MAESSEAKRAALLKQLRHEIPAGAVLFEEGEDSRELYILLKGTLEVRAGGRQIARIEEPNTYLGEMSTLLGVPRTATVVAQEDAALVRIPEERVADFFTHSPALAVKLARILAERLQGMNERLQERLHDDAEARERATARYERLVCTVPRRALLDCWREQTGSDVPLGDLRERLGVSVAETGRILADFTEAGLLEADADRVRFLACEDEGLATHLALAAEAAPDTERRE